MSNIQEDAAKIYEALENELEKLKKTLDEHKKVWILQSVLYTGLQLAKQLKVLIKDSKCQIIEEKFKRLHYKYSEQADVSAPWKIDKIKDEVFELVFELMEIYKAANI